jgi:hypothetical protein
VRCSGSHSRQWLRRDYRSKLFAFERLGNSPTIDASRIAEAIEMTRFPVRLDHSTDEALEPKLVQAADLIGQLGDPMYSRKANALYSEFEEIGMNRQLGYSSPADIIDKYPAFFGTASQCTSKTE